MVQPTGLPGAGGVCLFQRQRDCHVVGADSIYAVGLIAVGGRMDVFHLRFGNVFFQRADVEACKADDGSLPQSIVTISMQTFLEMLLT